MAGLWVPEPASPYHSTRDYLRQPLYRASLCHTYRNDIVYQVEPFITSRNVLKKYKNTLFLEFHGLAAAGKFPFTPAGYNIFRATFLAKISFSNLISHFCHHLP
jgi:hypothetical protein